MEGREKSTRNVGPGLSWLRWTPRTISDGDEVRLDEPAMIDFRSFQGLVVHLLAGHLRAFPPPAEGELAPALVPRTMKIAPQSRVTTERESSIGTAGFEPATP